MSSLSWFDRPFKLFGVLFCPLRVPHERRLQMVAVIHYVCIFMLVPILSVVLPVYLLMCSSYWWSVLLYGIWMYIDKDTPRKGSRRSRLRFSSFWRHMADYFPIRLHRTVELDSKKNYIFGYHPHGICAIGAFTCFATNGTDFDTLFPGFTSRLCTLFGQFFFPLRRDYIILGGAVSCCRSSLEYLLTRNGSAGQIVSVVVGGAREILNARPHTYNLILKNRKGFVKMALRLGVDLVPVFGFGEVDIYHQYANHKGTRVRRVQDCMKTVLGFAPPIFRGRGIFNYTLGLIPYRTPINVVVGRPVPVKKATEPTEEDIDELHERYIAALIDLFETHKGRFNVPSDVHLNIT